MYRGMSINAWGRTSREKNRRRSYCGWLQPLHFNQQQCCQTNECPGDNDQRRSVELLASLRSSSRPSRQNEKRATEEHRGKRRPVGSLKKCPVSARMIPWRPKSAHHSSKPGRGHVSIPRGRLLKPRCLRLVNLRGDGATCLAKLT